MSGGLLEAVTLRTSLQTSVRSTVPGQVYIDGGDCEGSVRTHLLRWVPHGAGCCMHRSVQVCGPRVVCHPRVYQCRVEWCLLCLVVVVVSTPSRAWARTGSQTSARGPPSFSPHTSSSAATPTGSVHKSQTVSVVSVVFFFTVLVQLCRFQSFYLLSRVRFWLADSLFWQKCCVCCVQHIRRSNVSCSTA